MKLEKVKDATLAPAKKIAIVGDIARYWKRKEDYDRIIKWRGKDCFVDKFDKLLAYYDDMTNVTVIVTQDQEKLDKLKSNPNVKFATIIDNKPVKDSDDLGAQIEKLMAQYKEKYGVDYKPGQATVEPAEITEDTIVTEDNLPAIQKQLEEDIGDVVVLTVNFTDVDEARDIPVKNLYLAINGDELTFNYDTEDDRSAYIEDIANALYQDFAMDLDTDITYRDIINKLTGTKSSIYVTSGVEE